jgi:hypothetical protein
LLLRQPDLHRLQVKTPSSSSGFDFINHLIERSGGFFCPKRRECRKSCVKNRFKMLI